MVKKFCCMFCCTFQVIIIIDLIGLGPNKIDYYDYPKRFINRIHRNAVAQW